MKSSKGTAGTVKTIYFTLKTVNDTQTLTPIVPTTKAATTAEMTSDFSLKSIPEEKDPLPVLPRPSQRQKPVLPAKTKLYTSTPDISNKAKFLVQAVIDKDRNKVNFILNTYPKTALQAVPLTMLKNLTLPEEDQADILTLTALQCACLYHPDLVDVAKKILTVIGDEQGVLQLGKESLEKLKVDIEKGRDLRMNRRG